MENKDEIKKERRIEKWDKIYYVYFVYYEKL